MTNVVKYSVLYSFGECLRCHGQHHILNTYGREKPVASEVFGGAKGVSVACLFLPVCPCGAPPLHTSPHIELKLPTKLHSLKGSFRHLVFARERKERERQSECEHVEHRHTHV